jgi:hypothetical protein
MSPKGSCVEGLVHNFALLGHVGNFEVGSSWKSSGHEGISLEGTLGYLTAQLLPVPLFCFCFFTLLCHLSPTMMCCLTVHLKATGSTNQGLKPPKLWAKVNFSFISWLSQVFCYHNKSWLTTNDLGQNSKHIWCLFYVLFKA